MIMAVISGLWFVCLLFVLGYQWYLGQQIIQRQLQSHKMMFSGQIKNARRVYLRGLYRQSRMASRLRLLAWILEGAAIVGTFLVLGDLLPDMASNLGLRSVTLTRLLTSIQPSDGEQTSLLIGTMVLVITASAIWSFLARWQFDQQKAADQSVSATASDLYWTPPDQLKRQYSLRLTFQGLVAVGAILLIVSQLMGWLPYDQDFSGPTAQPFTQTSAPSHSEASSTSSPSSAASESSSQTQAPETVYPIDAMKAAALAPSTTVAGLTTADYVALAFSEYWTLNGLQMSEIAQYANATDESYQYHLVTGTNQQVIAFSGYVPSVSQTDYLFYLWIDGENVRLYNMFNTHPPVTSFTTQFNLTVQGTSVTPVNAEIRDSAENIRRLITAFRTDPNYERIRSGVKQGDTLPL